MARLKNYPNDSDVTASDRLSGIDSSDNSIKNFTIDDIAQFFASTGIADPTKTAFYYTVDRSNIIPTRGKVYFNFNEELENTPVGIIEIIINRNDGSGRGADAQGMDFAPLRRFAVGNNIKVTDTSTASSTNYGIYEITAVTENGASLILSVNHLASSGSVPLTDLSLNIINGAPIEGGTRGNAIFDGAAIPTHNEPAAINGDVYFRLFENDLGDGQVDLYLFVGNVWTFQATLTGVQGYQGIGISDVSSDSTGINPGGATEVTVSYNNPVPGSDPIDPDTFLIEAGHQGTGVQAITQTSTPELGEITDLEVTYNDPSGNTPPVATQLMIPAGVQGDQGLFYLTLFKVYDKTPTPDVTAPEGVIFNETTGFTNLPLDDWYANPQDHDVSTQSLYELRQDVNPRGAYDADRNITFTAASWGSPFVAGDQGPIGDQGDQGIGVDVDAYTPPVNTELGTPTTVSIPLNDPSGDTTPDPIVFDIPSGVQGGQGDQGIGVDVDSYTPPTNTVLGTPTTVTIPLIDPTGDTTPGNISFDIPSGVAGVNSILTNATGSVNREATVGNEMATVTDGVLTISLTPHMGTVIDSPHPQDAVAPNRTQTYTGTTLDYAVTITDVYPSVYTYTLTSVTRLSGDTNFVIPSITAGTTNSVTISTAATGSATFRAQLVATHAGSSQTTVTHHDFALHSIAPVVPTDTYRTRETDSENFNTDLGNYTNSNITPAFGTRITFRRPDGVSGDWFGYLAIPRSVLVLDPELNFNSGVAVPDPIGTDVGTPAFDFFRFPFTGPIKVIEITE